MSDFIFIDGLFLFLSLLVVYIYVGYPPVLYLLARCFPKKHDYDDAHQPSVTLIISAFNEEAVIEEKMRNALSMDYPEDKLNILVVSDGSTDGTEAIVKSFSAARVRLIRPEERKGKTAGLNLALEQIDSEIVVFSDANAIYDKDAVKKLVRHFSDRGVGYVVGHARYQDADESAAGQSESDYWSLEVKLKQWESDFSSVVGGDGAIYAIRRTLWQPLLETDINDFVNPLQIIAQGFRGIFDSQAWCSELPAGHFDKEFERKKRIANRSFNGLLRVPVVLNPFKVGRFSFLVVSHKLLRWFSPFFISLHFIMVVAGVFSSSEYAMGYIIFAGFYYLFFLLAMLGEYQDRVSSSKKHAIFYYPYYLYLLNVASAVGLIMRIRGRKITKWTTVREGNLQKDKGSLQERLLIYLSAVSLFVVFIAFAVQMYRANFFAYLLLLIMFYAYFGYPTVIALIAHLFYRTPQVEFSSLPTVTLLITAYNEELIIGEKLRNSLELDYPRDRLRILVVSDGSTDKTSEIMETFREQGVDLLILTENRGKATALNVAMENVNSEIVVFSDANVTYQRDAIRQMVKHFGDDSVGVVSGRVVLLNDDLSYGVAENSYYGFEHFIQDKEGASGAVIGADGAMYAIRSRLFEVVDTKTILDDFVISMRIMCQGYKVLHEHNAIGYEKNTAEIESEYVRKRRIIAGGIQALMTQGCIPKLAQPFLLFKFVSHKLLRWLIGPVFVLLLVDSMVLLMSGNSGWFLPVFLVGSLVTMVVAVVGFCVSSARGIRGINLIIYLYMLFAASCGGCFYGITGRQSVTWKRRGCSGDR